MLADGDPRRETIGLSQPRRGDLAGGNDDGLPGGAGQSRKPGLHRRPARLCRAAQAELAEPVMRYQAIKHLTTKDTKDSRRSQRIKSYFVVFVKPSCPSW